MTSSASLKIIVVYFYGTYLIGIICKSKEKNLEIYGTNMEIHEKKLEIHGKYFGNTRKRRRKFQLHCTPLLNREKDLKKLTVKLRVGHYSIIDLPGWDWNPSCSFLENSSLLRFVKNYLKSD